jgi:protoporphyrinogen oxidase
VLLERAGAVGGLSSSFDVAGVRVDHGSHRLHPATPPAVLADLHELLGTDLQLRRRHGRLRVAGRWVGFPLRASELARALPRPMLAGIARDAATAPLRRPREDSYADVLRSGLGPTLYDALYGPYARKLWGLPGERISGEQARRRVTADTPWKVAARVVRGGGNRRRGRGQGAVFSYPRRGFGQIVDALADAAVSAGAAVHTGAEVERPAGPRRRRQRPAGQRPGRDGGARLLHASYAGLARMTSPAPPLAAVEAASRLRFRAMVLVYVVHDGGRWTEYDAHYLPGPETPITRISEPANYRESAEDPADRTVLCAEIPCSTGDAIWEADEAALGDLVEEALAVTGLPPVRRADVVVRRVPHVYPVYGRGYEGDLRRLDAWASSLARVTTFGRLGLFAHDNTHHALAMGYDAVDALGSDGRWDVDAWAAARERFAAHVVED